MPLTQAAIEAHFLEAIALQDWDTVAVCERALTGMVSVATMKRHTPEACVLVQVFELVLAGVPSGMAPVPQSYLRITTMTQDMAIALLEEKIGQLGGLEQSTEPRHAAATRAVHNDDDMEVSVEVDVDVSDFGQHTDSAVVIHDRLPTPAPFLDCTDLDNANDDKTVVPS